MWQSSNSASTQDMYVVAAEVTGPHFSPLPEVGCLTGRVGESLRGVGTSRQGSPKITTPAGLSCYVGSRTRQGSNFRSCRAIASISWRGRPLIHQSFHIGAERGFIVDERTGAVYRVCDCEPSSSHVAQQLTAARVAGLLCPPVTVHRKLAVLPGRRHPREPLGLAEGSKGQGALTSWAGRAGWGHGRSCRNPRIQRHANRIRFRAVARRRRISWDEHISHTLGVSVRPAPALALLPLRKRNYSPPISVPAAKATIPPTHPVGHERGRSRNPRLLKSVRVLAFAGQAPRPRRIASAQTCVCSV